MTAELLLSVWPVAQKVGRAQRSDRYLAVSGTHPAKMLPEIARRAVATYTDPGDLVLDPMCGIGTTLVEAVHLGRDAMGVEYEQPWAELARANVELARGQGAPGHAEVFTGDARSLDAIIDPAARGLVALVVTSPPYGASLHGQVRVRAGQGLAKSHDRYSRDPANLAHQSTEKLLEGFTTILRSCERLLRPGGFVVVNGQAVAAPRGAGRPTCRRPLVRTGSRTSPLRAQRRPLGRIAGRHTRTAGLILPARAGTQIPRDRHAAASDRPRRPPGPAKRAGMRPGHGDVPGGETNDLLSPERGGVVCVSDDGRRPEEVRRGCLEQRQERAARGHESSRVPLTLVEAAGYLNVTERYMRRLVAERRIPYFKVGRLLRFSAVDLDSYLEACRVEPPPVHPLLRSR
jgi:excisionase family DNA binding protein